MHTNHANHTDHKDHSPSKLKALVEILYVSTKLGLTSFGGPIAHLGYFHDEYVRRRKWIDERSYTDLVALCQFLPGPASSQVGIGIGVMRAGIVGGIVSFLGFTLPSVIALVLIAYFFNRISIGQEGWIHGLKIVAVAVVAQAILGMGRSVVTDRRRIALAIAAIAVALLWQTAWSQVCIIVVAGVAGWLFFKPQEAAAIPVSTIPIRRSTGICSLILFIGLLVLLPFIREFGPSQQLLAMFDSFYRSGSLVFGGGHVVLPLLEKEVVPSGWVTKEQFLAGYGVTQAVPGPLFTFGSYLGAVMSGWHGAIAATLAIFLPAFLLVIGALPFWHIVRSKQSIQGALIGIQAAVVGILIAAWYDPIWTSSILAPADFVLGSILFAMLTFWKLPPWAVVVTGAVGGYVIAFI